ncbi:MAG: TFIIB-type zinc finger domain-containing protein [Clostridia bacterium]
MKALVCELCGSNDIVKQDGYFVCQACGTKYTLEEAKKLMIEGVVDIQGTVKVDTSDKIQNYYTIARRAKDTGNNEEAGRYYDLILQEQPDSWEATFYITYFSCSQTNNAGIGNAVVRLNKTVKSVLDMIGKIADRDEQMSAIDDIAWNASSMYCFLYDAQCNFFNSIALTAGLKYSEAHALTIDGCCIALYNLGDTIKAKFPEKTFLATKMWEIGVKKEEAKLVQTKETKATAANRKALIKKYDPNSAF